MPGLHALIWPLVLAGLAGLGGCSLVVESELASKDDAGGIADVDVSDTACDPELEDCECAPGTERRSGGCEWIGFVEDPGFERGEDSPWDAAGDAFVDASAGGSLDPGMARFDTFALCGEDMVSQSVTLPSFEELGPEAQERGLVLEASYRGAVSDFGAQPAPIVELGDWATLNFPASGVEWRTERRCLGTAALGHTFSFSARGTVPDNCGGGETYNLDLDRLAIDLAEPGECPAAGPIPNGNFESDEGWSFVCQSSNNEPVSCEYAEDGGAGGSRSAHLTTTRGCSSSGVVSWISIPRADELPNLAIELWVSGSLVDPLRVFLDEGRGGTSYFLADQIGSVAAGEISPQIVRFCVPPESLGQVERLVISVSTGGACLMDKVNDVHIDNVQFASDVGCAP